MLWTLIPGMAILNRASGMTEWFPGRNIYATSLLALLFGWWLIEPVFGLALCMSMLVYRLPGWYKMADIGTVTGNPVPEFFGMAFRATWFFPAFIYAYSKTGNAQVVLTCLVAAAFGFALSYAIGMRVIKLADRGVLPEVFGGASLGAGLYAALSIGHA